MQSVAYQSFSIWVGDKYLLARPSARCGVGGGVAGSVPGARTLNLGVVGLSPIWGVEYLKKTLKKKMLGLGEEKLSKLSYLLCDPGQVALF